MNKRILLKLSGEALMGGSPLELMCYYQFYCKRSKKVHKLGYQICIIIGGGNIFRGIKGASEGIDRSTSDYMGMLATVMNALSFQSCLEKLTYQQEFKVLLLWLRLLNHT